MTDSTDDPVFDLPPNMLVAINLANHGFAVFPVRDWGDGDGWKPIKAFPARASDDPHQIVQWWEQWPEARVGLLTGKRNGITVLDLDTKNGKDGIAELFDLGFADVSVMSPVRVRTPTGGLHLIFAYHPRMKNWVGKLAPGIDVRTEGGFVIAPGSYKDDTRYVPEGQLLGTCPLPAFPEALVPPPEPELMEPVGPIDKALRSQCKWAKERLGEFADELGETPEGNRNSSLNNAAMWAGGAGARGFLSRAEAEAALRIGADLAGLRASEFRATFKSGWEAGLGKPIREFPQPDADIARLNACCAVVSVGGKTLIATERDDGGFDFGRESDLHALYANDRVPKAKPAGSTEPVSSKWMRHPDRHTYPGGVEFAPGGTSSDVLNLWRGFAVEPNPNASCELFLQHLPEVICRGNEELCVYILGWLAHMVQHPEEKPGVGLVLRGPKGAGKDTVVDYLRRMIGKHHAPTVMNSNQFAGRFNAIVESALLLQVQEGFWAGDKAAESTLKGLVTSPIVAIERKGVDTINVTSVLRLIITANAEWVVPASHDERRWAVLDVSGTRARDKAYFDPLWAEMEGEGPAALLHYLQSYDLSGFDVRKAPQTEGLLNQKLASLRGIHRWWSDVLHSGEIGTYATDHDGDWDTNPLIVTCRKLQDACAAFMRGRRFEGDALDSREFGRQLRLMLPSVKRRRLGSRSDRAWHYILPAVPVARNEFASWLREPIDWEEHR